MAKTFNIVQFEVQDKRFKGRLVNHHGYGDEVCVGEEALEETLFDEDFKEKFEGALSFDEGIYGYCELEHIMNDSDEDFEEYINTILD